MMIHQWFERFNMNITVCWQSFQCLPSTAALRNANMEGFPQTTGNTQEQKGQIRVSQKTWKKKRKPAQLWNKILWADETKINLYQDHGKRRVLRIKGAARDSKHTTSSVKHSGGNVTACACMAANGTGSRVFIDDVTADRNSRMYSEVYRAILSVQIQPNAAKLIGRCFKVQMDNDSKHTSKAAQKLPKAKKCNIHQPNRLASTQRSLLFTYWRQNWEKKNPKTSSDRQQL